jgi:tetratricopeptide (TPR) repeat protein
VTTDGVRRWSEELARNPNSVAFVRLADELRRKGELGEARAVALRGLERHPYRADAHDALARVMADEGNTEGARDEWDMALRIDAEHLPSLKGLGFLAYRIGDLANAERYLHQARAQDPTDEGVSRAYERVSGELRATPNESKTTTGKGDVTAPNGNRANGSSAAVRARELFASLLGDGDRTALLLDRDGLVLAGTYLDEQGRDAGDEIGAELSGVSEEATRALSHLGLGAWHAILVEAQHATLGLAPGSDGAIVLVAAARDTHVGFVRRLLNQARDRAEAWLGGAA